MFYSASNAKLKIDDHEILASNARLSLSASVEPAYVAGARHSDVFRASNGIGGELSFNYYLTGTDYLLPDKAKLEMMAVKLFLILFQEILGD